MIAKNEVAYRVNLIEDEGSSLILSLQTTAVPNYGIKITVFENSRLSDDGYQYLLSYIEEIGPLEYEGGELEESVLRIVNEDFDARVTYVYFLESVYLLVFRTESLFLWSMEDEEWQLRVGENGRASLDEIYDLNYLSGNVIKKAEELRGLGDPAYWGQDLSSGSYSIDLASGEIFFSYSGNKWIVSLDQENWDDAASVSNGQGDDVRSLVDVDMRFIGELESKNFKEGMNILNSKEVLGRLDYLFRR